MRELLLKAILGSDAVEGSLLLNTAERELQHDKALQDQAELELPSVMETIKSLSTKPIREIRLDFYPDTLREDPDIILEVRLKLNAKFNASMSFYIAQYQEGNTWPEEYSFREPDYHQFFLSLMPRLDVQLSWFDRRIRLRRVISTNAAWGIGPVSFIMEFDGSTFKPKDGSLFEQTFQVPNLDTLASSRSEVQLFSHRK